MPVPSAPYGAEDPYDHKLRYAAVICRICGVQDRLSPERRGTAIIGFLCWWCLGCP